MKTKKEINFIKAAIQIQIKNIQFDLYIENLFLKNKKYEKDKIKHQAKKEVLQKFLLQNRQLLENIKLNGLNL